MVRRAAIGLALGGVGLMLSGCNKPLFPEELPRSQYARYEQLRGQERPLKETGMYGQDQPALRNRLRPLEQP